MDPRFPTPDEIAALREQFKHAALYQLETPDGRAFVVRGSSYDEFSRLVKATKGNEARLGVHLVQTLVVWPAIDAQDLEYNTSGAWEPGLVASLSEKIQEALGYSKDVSVKKL